MATSHPDLSQEVSQMSVDQLKDVLDDVVNHQKPESEKSSLVRRLKEEASKDEMSLEPHGHFLDSGSQNSKRKGFKGLSPRTVTAQSLGRNSGRTSNSSSQSLQDLATSENGPINSSPLSSSSSFKSSGSRKLNKATRANSFSLASNSPCPPNVSDVSQTRSSSASGVGTWTNKKSTSNNNNNCVSSNTTNSNNSGNISTRTLSSSAASSSLNDDYSDALTLNSSHVDVNDKNNNNDCDREVEGGEPSARHPLSCTSSLKTYSHHSLPEDTTDTTQTTSQLTFKDQDQTENAIEMQDLRHQARFVNYNSTVNNNSVDSVVQFSDLTTREPDDPQYARRIHLDNSNDGPNTSLDIRDRQIIRPYPLDDPSPVSRNVIPANPPVNNTRLNKKKAKQADEPKVLAEHIEGYIGDKDVEYLVHYVAGSDSNKSSSNAKVPASATGNSRKKPINGKEPRKRAVTDGGITNGCLEEESREGSPTEDIGSNNSSKFNKYPFTKSESLDSPAVSPSQAPSIASCVEYGRGEYSEDEMGYHSDREGGFVPYTRRKKVRGQSQKILHTSNKARSVGNSSFASAASSPLSNTPSVISASSVSAQGTTTTTCRGYESEREYYAEDRKQASRRKGVSSMPHSEQNSPENSDVDSSLSLPVAAHRIQAVQKVSYAKMAASHSLTTSKLPSDIAVDMVQDQVPPPSTPVEDINLCINIKHHVDNTSHNQLFLNTSSTNCDLKPAASNTQQATLSSPSSSLPSSIITSSSHHQTKIINQDLSPQPTSPPSFSFISHSVDNELARSTKTPTTISNDDERKSSGDADLVGNTGSIDLPAVIMFGEAAEKVVEGIPDLGSASFTFGFFDDLQAPELSTTMNSVEMPSVKVDNNKLSSSRIEVKRKMVYKASGPDIDTNSFNYNEILVYIQNAWDSATRSIKSLNMKGSGVVTSEL